MNAPPAQAAALGGERLWIEKVQVHTTPAVDTAQVQGRADAVADLQALLALWRRAWPEAQQIPLLRSILAVQAKQWADQVMRHVAEDVR